jgi:hypothetical protein
MCKLYGRTTGWDDSYDGDVFMFRRTNLVRDALGLVAAFGHRSAAVVGRDAGRSAFILKASFQDVKSKSVDIAPSDRVLTGVDVVIGQYAALPAAFRQQPTSFFPE